MTFFVNHIKKFTLHKASVWALKWSSFGDFLISCGIDGIIFIWGFNLILSYSNLNERQIIEKFFYQNWNFLSFFKSFYFRGSFRRVNFCENFNTFCVSTFSGKVLICKIFFLNFYKTVDINENFYLDGFLSEIKDGDFSKNGLMMTYCTRDKALWFWEKIVSRKFQCFLILHGHESDIKKVIWHPRFAFLISSTYNGFVRVFQKKNYCIRMLKLFNFSDNSLLNIELDTSGNSIFFCSNQGELIILLNFLFSEYLNSNSNKKKTSTSFFFLSRLPLFGLNFSKTNAFVSITGDDETFHILKNFKIKKKKKELQGLKEQKILQIEKSFFRLQFGTINTCIWHPKNENIFVTSGEDGNIHFWSFLCF
jgi:WD40 repeat protein